MKKRRITLVLCLILTVALFIAAPLLGVAKDKDSEKLLVSTNADKESYGKKDIIGLSVVLENTNYYPLTNVSVKVKLPEGLEMVDSSSISEPVTLSPGESRTFAITVQGERGGQILTYILIGVVAIALIIGAYIWYDKKKKGNNKDNNDHNNDNIDSNENVWVKTISLVLCVCLFASFLPITASAEEKESNEEKTISSTVNVNLAKESYKVKFTVSYQNVEVSEYTASVLGINADEFDSDGDGLGNYIEIYHCGTDPAFYDSDENGISDADEDADSDGLTNIQEQEYETNPGEADTDGDGLSDYEEIFLYYTDPCRKDTDGDGLSDSDEIMMGLDPLAKKSDGKTLDSKRVVFQTLSSDNIDEELIDEENDAIPSLTSTTSGSINEKVHITKSESGAFGDSRAIVGEAIEVNGDSIPQGRISFTLKRETAVYMNGYGDVNTSIICKYNEDGSVEYLETDYDEYSNTISANISKAGTYYVLDVQKMFDEMGLDFPNMSGYASMSKKGGYVNVMAQADIVFIIDSTGSMGDEIYNVKTNVQYFLDALKSNGISAGLALIDYKDIYEDGYDSTQVHKYGTSNWFYDISAYEQAISRLDVYGGGDAPESVVDALETARLLDMRPSAGKIFILVTDASYKSGNRYGIASMEQEIQLLNNAGITCAVVSSYDVQTYYYSLYTETNGIWANIYGDFHSSLVNLAEKIGNEIVGDGFWIYLDGPVPMPVRLDAEPSSGSTVDTDGDGLYDINELKELTPSRIIDLDELLTIVSKGAITGTDYGSVMAYKYDSNPAAVDSDYDGISDDKDDLPMTNYYSGKMDGHMDLSLVDYAFDLRYFLNSELKYDQNIAKMSLLLSNIVYDCGAVTYNHNGKKVSSFEEMLIMHGFDDSAQVYSLKNDGGYTDDDISDVGYGYIDVEYNGRKTRVVAVSVRGTDGSVEEWSSNLDMGDTSEWYYPYHKGFYTAEERIRTQLYSYVNGLDSTGITNTVYWVTGHSRGAAIANILASKLIDDGYKTVAYTFATPATTTMSNWNSYEYNSIFNFTNLNDVVGYVPLEQWGFRRFGITYSFKIDNFSDRFNWTFFTGDSSYDALNTYTINLLLDRLYKYACSSWYELHEYSGEQNISDKQLGYISERAMKYCEVERRYSLSGKENGWKLYPSMAFILQILAELIADSTPQQQKDNNTTLLTEFMNTKYAFALLVFLGDGFGTYLLKNNANVSLAWADAILDISAAYPGIASFDVMLNTHSPATYYIMIPQRIK